MRRMRERFWPNILFVIPVIVISMGVRLYIKKNVSESPHVALMKPSSFPTKNPSPNHVGMKEEPEIVLNTKEDGAEEETAADSDVDDASRSPAFISSGSCGSVEYPGSRGDQARLTRPEWNQVMVLFHEAKAGLLKWLEHRKKEIPAITANLMENNVRMLRIYRPPVADDPGMSWRGTGLMVKQNDGGYGLWIGGGFLKLIESNRKRAKFELTRLIAQSWSPCELKREASSHEKMALWSPLLGCLGVAEEKSCEAGSYSETGWAVATTVAAQVSAPGCVPPVFESPSAAKCLREIPLPVAAPGAKEI